MIEWLFMGVFEWFYAMAMGFFEYCAQSLLSVFSFNITYFEQSVPAAGPIYSLLLAVAWAVLLGNCVFQSLRSMMTGIGIETDDPKETFLRTFLFSFLLLFARQICDIPLRMVEQIVTLLNMPDNIPLVNFESALSGIPNFGWLFAIICGLVVTFQMVKLFIEVGERYVVLAMLTILSPLAFSMGGSKATKDIFSGWVRMYASMCLMTILNIITVKILFSALATIPLNDATILPGIILIIGICRMARRIDSVIARIGLNPAITGEPLRGGIGTAAMMVMRTTSSMAKMAGAAAKGASGKSGGGRGPGTFKPVGQTGNVPSPVGSHTSDAAAQPGASGSGKPSRPPISFGRNPQGGQPPAATQAGSTASTVNQSNTSQYSKPGSSPQPGAPPQRPGKQGASPISKPAGTSIGKQQSTIHQQGQRPSPGATPRAPAQFASRHDTQTATESIGSTRPVVVPPTDKGQNTQYGAVQSASHQARATAAPQVGAKSAPQAQHHGGSAQSSRPPGSAQTPKPTQGSTHRGASSALSLPGQTRPIPGASMPKQNMGNQQRSGQQPPHKSQPGRQGPNQVKPQADRPSNGKPLPGSNTQSKSIQQPSTRPPRPSDHGKNGGSHGPCR